MVSIAVYLGISPQILDVEENETTEGRVEISLPESAFSLWYCADT